MLFINFTTINLESTALLFRSTALIELPYTVHGLINRRAGLSGGHLYSSVHFQIISDLILSIKYVYSAFSNILLLP